MVQSLLRFIASATVINICINLLLYKKITITAHDCGGTNMHMHCLGASQRLEYGNHLFFENNTQGSVPYPTIRNDAGPLPHKLLTTKSVSTPKSCAAEGDRTKHVTKASAASLQWEDGSGQASWEVKNVRKLKSRYAPRERRSHILVTTNRNQVVMKVDTIVATVTITHDDKELISASDSSNTWGSEDP